MIPLGKIAKGGNVGAKIRSSPRPLGSAANAVFQIWDGFREAKRNLPTCSAHAKDMAC